jgi:N-acetylmuramoyl-L-alanine amidase
VNSGATIQNGTTEVHVAWVVALKLKELLEAAGLKVVMTKSREDELVRNKTRADIANSSGAALMVRLHCDAGEDEGFALYAPDQQATKEGVTGPSRDVIEQSRLLAQTIDAEMSKKLSGVLKNSGVRGDSQTAVGSKQGALTASIFSKVPIVTIEMVVLSNEADAEFIKSETGQQKMAQAIADGINAFVANVEK